MRFTTHPVIYFDGDCGLCSRFVQYVLKHDRRRLFCFAPLQSEYARSRGFDIPRGSNGSLETMLVEWKGEVLSFSEGALTVIENLNGLHKLAAILRIIPRPLRDSLYRWIARHRYAIFGKAPECLVPGPEYQSRIFE